MYYSEEYCQYRADDASESEHSQCDSWSLLGSGEPALNTAEDTTACLRQADDGIEKVAAWIAKYSTMPAGGSAGAASRAGADSSRVRRRRPLSDASLADFLRCASPFRPSFMDKPRRQQQKQQPAPAAAVVVAAAAAAAAAAAIGEDCGNAADEAAAADSSEQTLLCYDRAGDAEFLGHAFYHFVSFQPLDFAPYAPLPPTPFDADEAGGSFGKTNSAGAWSYITRFFSDYSHDIHFY
ncbi:hypothetical protein H4217_002560 [Coemansia sp. RSA 1939]|nr:hypothetical protein H4217_002560 [Coemansia sp. RSA 1939]KAJ2617504.1 hypothetical protein EV177_000539 [Coemansia sp. RSA 1804]